MTPSPPDLDVLQTITDTDRRGAQVFAIDLQHALQTRGRTVRTVALAPGCGGLDAPVLGRTRLGIGTLRTLRHEVQKAKVVVGFGSSTLPACAVSSARTDTAFVYRSIGELAYWANTRARRLRVRAMLRRAEAVVVLWQRAAPVLTDVFGVPPSRVHVIPRGVDADRFRAIDRQKQPDVRRGFGLVPDAPTVVYVGALSVEKDVEAAVRAVAAIPECQLLVAGDGPRRSHLEAMADQMAGERVRFLGVVPHAAEVFAAGDVAVLPSRSEGLPGVLIEAGLCGLPAVATDVGGVRDVVVPGRTGRVVRPGDVLALQDALVAVLDRADDQGQAAREHCLKRFEIGAIAHAWDALLGPLL